MVTFLVSLFHCPIHLALKRKIVDKVIRLITLSTIISDYSFVVDTGGRGRTDTPEGTGF